MYYFLNKDIGRKLTGIEHAAVARLKIFQEKQLTTKILTTLYNPHLFHNVERIGLKSNDVLNMFHYFQKAEPVSAFTVQDLVEKSNFQAKQVGQIHDYRIYDQQQKYLMYVSCFPNSPYIHYINYFDQKLRKYKRAIYDAFGFLSKEVFLGEKNSILFEIYYDIFGQRVLEYSYSLATDAKEVTQITLYHQERTLFFSTEQELIEYWLKQLLNQPEKTFFIIDRNLYFNAIVAKLEHENLRKISIIHSLHVTKLNAVTSGNILSGYKIPLEQHEKFDAVVVSTQQQKHDIQQRFPNHQKIHVIQPTYCSNQLTPTKPNKTPGQPIKIISLGRYFYEKRLEHIIEAVHRNRDQNIQLDLYGFPDGRDKEKTFTMLKALVKQYKLEDMVHFKGYHSDIKSILPEYDIAMVTSRLEGFCIAILDTMNQGVPNIAYDIKYGPAEMIDHDINGCLVENGNLDALCATLRALVEDENKRLALANNAYVKSLTYAKKNMAEKWQLMLNQL